MTWLEDTKSSVAISTGGYKQTFMKVTIVPFIKIVKLLKSPEIIIRIKDLSVNYVAELEPAR